jgi:hypothetical protein
MATFGIIVSHVVTIVGTPSYTSGAQLWKGAAATLNSRAIPIITRARWIPLLATAIEHRRYSPSKFETPVNP